jgi:small subunit ribosomal protein S6
VRSYDLVYVVRPDLEQESLKSVVDRMSQRITDQGGTIEAVDVWGKKRMSFVVGKGREGIFVHTRFAIDTQKVVEIRRAAALTEEVLRATITGANGTMRVPKTTEAHAAPPAPAPAAAPVAPPAEAPAPAPTAPEAAAREE